MEPVEVVTVGEAMVSLRAPGLLRMATVLDVSVAGAESNVAIGLARLGHRVRWLGRVGDDELGLLVLRSLRAEGVLVDTAVTTPGEQTGLVFFDRGPGGGVRVHYRRAGSAATRITSADLDPALASAPRLLHLTGITPALGPGPAAAVAHAAATAHAAGTLVCLDVNFRSSLWSSAQARSALRPLLPDVDIVVASEDELTIVADGAAEDETVAELLGAGPVEVVVKRGAAGASAFTAAGRADHGSVPVETVNTVGAGDAFTAGYLSALLDGGDIAARLQRAVVMGAAAVSAQGDWEGLPLRAELDQVGGPRDEARR
ncbi:sugar kinase [Terrabacter sp. GCM10028922]|uniref:sugar kinase n=1 Tax=Terrabacter sp. GCM10028922 TaxID=3273428 RepID=UPI003621211F